MNRFLVKGSGLILIICMGLLSGCSARICDFTMVSTKSVTLDKVDIESLPQTTGVEGKTSKWVVLFIPLGLPHLEDAVDDALDNGKGDLLLDGVVYGGGWSALLVGQNTIKVKGSVVKTRGAKGSDYQGGSEK